MPLSCETGINGAITLAILRACNLFEESEFLADLTIRHPQNDNAELLWHCGPFPYSLKKDGVEAKLVLSLIHIYIFIKIWKDMKQK